jgi:hypothetical protein
MQLSEHRLPHAFYGTRNGGQTALRGSDPVHSKGLDLSGVLVLVLMQGSWGRCSFQYTFEKTEKQKRARQSHRMEKKKALAELHGCEQSDKEVR